MGERGDAVHVLVSGRVQGVGFRWFTRKRARELGVRGWVANLDDGRVEVWAEGPPAALDQLVAWLRDGPPSARVEGVEVERGGDGGCLAPAHERVDW